MSNYITLPQAEQRIRQANSADEMLGVLALCGGYSNDFLSKLNKISQFKKITDDENATNFAKLKAYRELLTIDTINDKEMGKIIHEFFPKGEYYFAWEKFVRNARKELTNSGARMMKNIDVTKELAEVKRLKSLLEKELDTIECSSQEIEFFNIAKKLIIQILEYDDTFIEKHNFKNSIYKAIKKHIESNYGLFFNKNYAVQLIIATSIADKFENKLNELKETRKQIHDIQQKCLDKIKDKLLEASPITEEQATEWANKNISCSASSIIMLNRAGYPIEKFKNDCAEFYRLIGGQLEDRKMNVDVAKNDRANATGYGINIDTETTKRTLFHELAHNVELNNSGYPQCSKNFVLSKAISTRLKPLKLLTGLDYNKDEKAYEDHFYKKYVGKSYTYNATEVVSMGVQCLGSPNNLYEIFTKDPEHFNYTLGICLPKDKLERLSEQDLEEADNEKNNKKELLKKHFAKEKKRIGYNYIVERYIEYSTLKKFSVDGYSIRRDSRTKYDIVKQIDLSSKTVISEISLKDVQLTMYLFATRDLFEELKDKTIEELWNIANNMNGSIPVQC